MTEDETSIESLLRDSLREHAREAPDGTLLAEQIVLATAEAAPAAHRGWRSVVLPVLAAASAVGALVGGAVLVGSGRHSSAPPAVTSPSYVLPTLSVSHIASG